MSTEGQDLDRKSLSYALGKHEDADALACDCVGFANATGGAILLGIEDDQTHPPRRQRIADDLPDRLAKRISQLTVNVFVTAQKQTAPNGGEYVDIRVAGNRQSIASTSDGRFFLRVADETQPLRGDDLGRLMTERNTFVWELQTTRRTPSTRYDPDKMADFVARVRESDRISEFVRAKSDQELLEHYLLVKDGFLTNLGILWVGRRQDRAAMLYPPEIQVIKYDQRGKKVQKYSDSWDCLAMTPMDLITTVWRDVPEWRDSYELPEGMFRTTVPHYEEVVVRELLANALVHRPYTQRGDIFVNLHPDRLEVHNPGLLPIGVTPGNILHASSKRNPHLARVFYDLKLMEGEGSGYDRMYEVLLSSGRPTPEVQEGDDRVVVIIRKQIVRPEIIDFMTKADQSFQPTQKELITLGLIAQHECLRAVDLKRLLELRNAADLRHWMGRLQEWGLVKGRHKTQAREYFVSPDILRRLDFRGRTTLKGIESPRLRQLILQDLERYREAKIGQIHKRIGPEISRRKVQRALQQLWREGQIGRRGQRKSTVYLFAPGTAISSPSGT
jgi:ATP-dependent DNA helicase RecG